MRTTLVPALLVVLLAAPETAPSELVEDSRKGAVCPLTRDSAVLLEEGASHSVLIRSQLAVLDASDLVVYITDVFDSNPREPKGKLQFVSAGAGTRYVIISLDRCRLSRRERLVLLAHELQHAVEIARDPAVRDVASFKALYSRIGWEVKAGRFETDGAREASARMRLDLLTPARASADSARHTLAVEK